ncbi:MAG: FtsX-like permease family protein, partial [Bacilli bacterium]|nr:FtsX-like permease family protein [Bacilli bacterium]
LIKTVAKIIIAAIFFIATILILLSIGSVSNSIMISVDQNKKFFGLLKTLGLKDKDIKDLIVIETFFTVIFGIIFASLTLLILVPLIGNLILYLLEFFLRHVYHEVYSTFPFHVNFPIYIPIISILVFTIFSVLFSRNSITKLTKANPIEIIKEVN